MDAIFCDPATGAPWFIGPSCAPGGCQAGIAADQQCCRCAAPPPPPPPAPCGDCIAQPEKILLDEFDFLDVRWQPHQQCQDDYPGGPWCNWDADGVLYVDSLYYDILIDHMIQRMMRAQVGEFSFHVRFVSCVGGPSVADAGWAWIQLGDTAAIFYYTFYDVTGQADVLRVSAAGQQWLFDGVSPPFDIDMSIVGGQLCVGLDKEEIVNESLSAAPPFNRITIRRGGPSGRTNQTWDTINRAAEFDDICLAGTELSDCELCYGQPGNILTDPFDGLDPGWVPRDDQGRWEAAGTLVCHSDAWIPPELHQIRRSLGELYNQYVIEVEILDCVGDQTAGGYGEARIYVQLGRYFGWRSRVLGDQPGLILRPSATQEYTYPGWTLPITLSFHFYLSTICFSANGVLVATLIYSNLQMNEIWLSAGGPMGRPDFTWETIENAATFDNLCIRNPLITEANQFSERAQKWLASVQD